ncbi:MAG TPA: molybdopterin cofactor-binding domain-containing protein [Vicinamibacteria bacterium]|nr:molybdopterin cofactor-binding domain-containing protein [Vicinamibacteria bacterium]
MSLRRATGQTAFSGDLSLPGTLHLALRRSPLAHARVVRADAAAARALPGVAMVLAPGEEGGLLPPVMRFVGDRLALAAAEEPELARRAADAVDLDLEPLPAVLDVEAASRDVASAGARVTAAEGDVDGAMAGAGHVLEGDWSLPYTPAVPLEPPLAITWLDEDRRLVVRTTADSPFRVRGILADRLALPAARIRVVRPLVAGGSFGRAQLVVEDLCALVTLRTGRPARLALSAEEELTTAPGRPAQRIRVRLAVTEGRLVGLDVGLLVDLGADDEDATELLRAGGRHALGLYRVPHLRFEARAVRTNRPPASAPRGADAGAALAVECAVNEAAALVGEDAAAFRRRNLRAPGDSGGEALAALGEARGREDARAVAELLHVGLLGGRPRRVLARPSAGPMRGGTGIGVARRAAGTEGRAQVAASLRLLDDGSFTLNAGPSAVGGTDEVAYAEAAAAILGVPPRRVVCAATDTDSAPFESGDTAPAYSSAGRAVEEAARRARERIREAGATLLGVPLADAAVSDGRVISAAGGEVSFAEVGAAALREGQPLTATAAPTTEATPPGLAAALADVEVDEETGVVRVTRLEAAVAGGPFTDSRPPESQVEGALAEALEQALAGGLSFDADGRPLVRSMRRWPLVASVDVPPLSVTFLPAGDPLSRFGAAALGEAAGRAALAAIVHAVGQATGASMRCLPLSPPRVLEALSARARR